MAAGNHLTRSIIDTHPPATSGVASHTVLSPVTERYVLGAEIDRGGMGIIYRATDTILGREVAVKVLQEKYGPESGVALRFADEARITGQLQHPSIPPVHDLGTLPDGRPFLAMKLIKGQTLEELLRDRPDPGAERGRFVAVFEQMCQALAYAHSHQVIHRDLKPANVMVGNFGEVQVMDWGLAKVLDRLAATCSGALADDPEATTGTTQVGSLRDTDGSFTQAGSVLGTPAFMPPEQAVGAVGKVDARSDVFGLGAVLAVILTGKPPFAAASAETTRVKAAQGDVAECLARLDACGAEPELVALCKRCLSPKPVDRPADAGAVAQAVAALRVAAEERARHAELARVRVEGEKALAEAREAEQRKRRLVQLLLVAAVVLLATAGVGFAIWSERQRRAADDQMQMVQLRAVAADESGDITRAVALFGELETLAQADPRLASYGPVATERREELVRFAAFKKAAAVALREGIHNIRSKVTPDPVLTKCEEALALAGLVDPDFDQSRIAIGFGYRERDATLELSRELLVFAAIRLAMFDTKDEAGKVNTRRALGLLDRAASLKLSGPKGQTITGPTAGELMLRMFWHRRLGENKEADEAGDKMTAMVKADGGFRTARDYYLLGSITLNILKKPKDALNAYREALKREPNHYGALFGSFLCHSELKDNLGQVAALTGCLAVRPAEPDLYYFRGMAYFAQEDFDAAYHDFDASVKREPNFKTGYFYRGRMLVVKDKWADAEKDFTKALELDPNNVRMRSWRAIALAKTGRPEAAMKDAEQTAAAEPTDWQTVFFAARAYAQAVRAVKDDKLAQKYGARCVGLLRQAFENGFTETSRLGAGSDFDPVRSRPDFQELLAGLAATRDKFAAFQNGSYTPASNAERLGLAEWCQIKKLHNTATGLYAAAFAADPKLADNLGAGHRYNAACFAALAAAGQGDDAAKLDDKERTRLRQQALDWLKADLALHTKQLETGQPADRAAVQQTMLHWQKDADLAGLRDAAALAKLPADEQKAFTQLWADVAALLKKAETPTAKEPK